MKLIKERLVIVTKIDKYELKYKGDNMYYSAKSKKQAEKLKAELVNAEKLNTAKRNDEEAFVQEKNRRIRLHFDILIDDLVTESAQATKYGKEERSAFLKEMRRRLVDIRDKAEKFVEERQ